MNSREELVGLTARIIGWALLGYVAFVTLGPLHDRPQFGFPNAERFMAFAAIGAAFTIGYPSSWPIATICLMAVASALEGAQRFVPHRDAHWSDLAVKSTGILAGIVCGLISLRLIVALCRRSRATLPD